jgi:glycosyltransferase involved in cell wall biosynthesis
MSNLGRKIYNRAFTHLQRPTKEHHPRLVILDDIFPLLIESFRIAEFNHYLSIHPDAVISSTGTSFSLVGENRGFNEILSEYEEIYPQFRERVIKDDPDSKLNASLVYCIFLNNAYSFLPRIEQEKTPFVFTLYQGGGFQLNDSESDYKLRTVLSSPCFQHVIVTDQMSQQYLLTNRLCAPENITFIYGEVHPIDLLINKPVQRRYFRQDKDTFDICFVAHKYMPKGIDKGFDVFLAVAKQLASIHPEIRLHVVGTFDESDGDIESIREVITFYGPQPTSYFPGFYASMDMILSPNVPFVLAPGAFDSCPTGCCIEAGICGVPVFCTDLLNLKDSLKDGEEIVIIPYDVEGICAIVEQYYRDYTRLRLLGDNGQATFRRIWDLDTQMAPRLQIITRYLK